MLMLYFDNSLIKEYLLWAECGKTARDTAENNVSNSCHYPRQEGKGGDNMGSPDYHPCKKGHGKRAGT